VEVYAADGAAEYCGRCGMEVYSVAAGAVGGLRSDPNFSLRCFESRVAAGEEVAGEELSVCGVMGVILFDFNVSLLRSAPCELGFAPRSYFEMKNCGMELGRR
jgi:hypothetical protein